MQDIELLGKQLTEAACGAGLIVAAAELADERRVGERARARPLIVGLVCAGVASPSLLVIRCRARRPVAQ